MSRDLSRAFSPSLAVAILLCLLAVPARADAPADYAFDQRPGATLPLDTQLTQSDGRVLRLSDLAGRRPLVLALGYFHCPSLCGVVRDDLLAALAAGGLAAGQDYDLLVVSIDPTETVADAAAAAAEDRQRYPAAGSGPGWHFLIGTPAAVAALAGAVGFKSRYDVQLKQFLHPAGLVVLTSTGTVSGYVLGVGYNAGDLRQAVTLASAGGIAKAALPLLLLCFHYDAATGRYGLEIMKVLRLAGLVTVVTIGGTLALAFGRERRHG